MHPKLGPYRAVYVFRRRDASALDPSQAWAQEAYVKASNTGVNHLFGTSTALSADGNTLAVGARGEDSAITESPGAGALYVLTRTDHTWSEQAYLKTSNAGAGDELGNAVALSGDGNTLAVAAVLEDSSAIGVDEMPNDDGTADNSGAVYVYDRP